MLDAFNRKWIDLCDTSANVSFFDQDDVVRSGITQVIRNGSAIIRDDADNIWRVPVDELTFERPIDGRH